jgi:hypothetical protein
MIQFMRETGPKNQLRLDVCIEGLGIVLGRMSNI